MKPSRISFAFATLLALAGCASNNVAYNRQANAKLGHVPGDRPPQLVHSENPIFPPGPRAAGNDKWALDIRVAFIVDQTGAVTAPTILSSTDSFYDSLVLECIRKWRFEPAMKDGRPVETKVVAPFQFRLR